MKTISIFGSTGTIGEKALKLATSSGFKIVAITANNNYKKAIEQAANYHPEYVCVTSNSAFPVVREALKKLDIKILPGSEINGLAKLQTDCLVMAISGIAGLEPTFASLGNTKRLAIATKEVIISAGRLLIELAKKHKTEIIPLDSEHNAVFQCLLGEDKNAIKDIVLTASGGPFVNFEEAALKNVTLTDALKHPNWRMGKKITIDSATLINKALEIIEAAYLFNFPITQIKPIIHPSSVIHALIHFKDGVFKAALSYPDMALPISYALNYPRRAANCPTRELDLLSTKLEFKELKPWQKRNIDLAYYASQEKKIITLNIANEYSVNEFLNGKLAFCDIYKTIAQILEKAPKEEIHTLDDIKDTITQSIFSNILNRAILNPGE